jgi:hypothetical protein
VPFLRQILSDDSKIASAFPAAALLGAAPFPPLQTKVVREPFLGAHQPLMPSVVECTSRQPYSGNVQ